MADSVGPDASYSIGDVAELTGISADTIRVWERRYGRPRAVRLASGHRRYTADHVRWLRRVAEALALGHRPSKLVVLDEEGVSRLLARPGSASAERPEVRRVLELTREFNGPEIRLVIRRAWTELGVRDSLTAVLMPLLERAGHAWADGEIQIRHEHFLSEIIEDELRHLRGSLTEKQDGPCIVFATMSGEDHGLGIQVAALVAVLSGWRVHIMGVNVPNEEIALAATELHASAVAVGISLATAGVENDRQLAHLRDLLPAGVRLAAGGRGARGARRGPQRIDFFDDLASWEHWLRQLPS